MANTYTRLIYHCIWSTKHRAKLIDQSVEERVWAYLAGIANENKMHAVRIGGIENHVHALLEIPKTMTVSEAMRMMKGGSSAWINEEGLMQSRFGWQDGYGAFTVSASNVSAVVEYIARQREHHRKMTFEEEYRAFLEKHGVGYDIERVFD